MTLNLGRHDRALSGPNHLAKRSYHALPPFERVLVCSSLVACIGLLAYKFFLSRRLSINWDEFYFLSHVYALIRGELRFIMQGAHTHLFTWLTHLPGDEVDQIVVARWMMLVLLCTTTWLIWHVARKCCDGFASLVPCFVYLSAIPVVIHGGSFRYDSIIAPLSVAALWLLWSPKHCSRRNEWLAGALIGAATAISIKVVLFAPLFLAAILTRKRPTPYLNRPAFLAVSASAMRVVLLAAATAGALLVLHSLTVAPDALDSLASTASSAARKAVLESPWFPRVAWLEQYVRWQPLFWLLIAMGVVLALIRQRFDVASLSLALLPVAIYRNAFPYYYVVMLAPASILVGYAVHELRDLVRSRSGERVSCTVVGVIWIGLLYQGVAGLQRLSADDQAIQRMLISGVHQIFPEPMNYIDRCGMISSFRKVNLFMSTWGIENYHARGEPFMPAAIRDRRPAFVLVNHAALATTHWNSNGLLPDDFHTIARFYPQYWGPVRVAGASAELSTSGAVRMEVPFPDQYRIQATGEILVDGFPIANGQVVDVPVTGIVVKRAASHEPDRPVSIRLFLAAAGAPPREELPPIPLFTGL